MQKLLLSLILLLGLTASLCATDPWQQPVVLTSSMCVTARVRINAADAASGDVLAAFVDVDGVPQLRGKASVQVVNGIAGCLIQIYTEADDEMISFGVWDESAEQIYHDPIYLASEMEGILGSYPDNMYQINAWNTPVADPWHNPQILPGSMTVMARVNICDEEAAGGDILAAFVNQNGIDVLRGKASVQVIGGIAGCLIQIFSQTNGEQIHFKVWDVDAQELYSDSRYLSSGVDTVVGAYPNSLYYINAGGSMQQVATPLFSPEGGIYGMVQHVVISCATPSAIIRYTTNGNDPDESSAIYTSPITVPLNSSLQLKAKAYLGGWMPSLINSASYSVTGQVADPTFSPPPQPESFTEPIHLSMYCSTPGASIHYTTNGTTPTPASPRYENPIFLPENSQWQFMARCFLDGWAPSNLIVVSYTITGTVARPNIAPPSETYMAPITVSMICSTPGASIRYTTDGSEPDMSSTLYTGGFTVSSSCTVKAKAFKLGWEPSQTNAKDYFITGTVAVPTLSPLPGTYAYPINVTMSCSTPGATIYYTTDGSEPQEFFSDFYSEPLHITSSCTFKAKAILHQWAPSPTVTAVYTITGTVPRPVFDPPPGEYEGIQHITISCSMPEAQIRYTIDNTDPNVNYGIIYSEPIAIGGNCTIRAIAYLQDWTPSYAYGIYHVTSAIPDEPPLPAVTGIQNLYPNPFGKILTIQLGIKDSPQDYRLGIYNLRGECIWERRGTAKGSFELSWDGCSAEGVRMPAGVYLLSFSSGNHRSLRKVLLR